MTLKVTGKVVIIFIIFFSCRSKFERTVDIEFQQDLDAKASKAIDSAYQELQIECEAKKKNQLPYLVDSLLQTNSIKDKETTTTRRR